MVGFIDVALPPALRLPALLSVQVSVADALAGPWSDPQPVGTGAYTTLADGTGPGRYIRFVADFVRGDKRAPEIGPQAFGLMPLLTKFEVSPRCGLMLTAVQHRSQWSS